MSEGRCVSLRPRSVGTSAQVAPSQAACSPATHAAALVEHDCGYTVDPREIWLDSLQIVAGIPGLLQDRVAVVCRTRIAWTSEQHGPGAKLIGAM